MQTGFSVREGLISIIVPCRNERTHVADAVGSLLAQDIEDFEIEVLVADGASDDGTRQILDEIAELDRRLRVLGNPEKRTPSALGILLSEAKGKFLIRADAHSIYPRDYVASLVRELVDREADNIGGVWDTQPWDSSISARAVAAALTSRFGVGVSYRTRRGSNPVEVETVPFGAWRSSHFEKFGPFDDRFLRAQDLEHNVRVRRMGGRILCLPWLKIRYFARPTLSGLARMAFDYGYWKIPVRAKHPVRFSVRQYLPPAMVAGTIICFVAGIWLPWAFIPILAYLSGILLAALLSPVCRKSPVISLHFAVALILMHFGYGIGYFRGLWDVFLLRRFRFSGECGKVESRSFEPSDAG